MAVLGVLGRAGLACQRPDRGVFEPGLQWSARAGRLQRSLVVRGGSRRAQTTANPARKAAQSHSAWRSGHGVPDALLKVTDEFGATATSAQSAEIEREQPGLLH